VAENSRNKLIKEDLICSSHRDQRVRVKSGANWRRSRVQHGRVWS